jgi:hypothetical protein
MRRVIILIAGMALFSELTPLVRAQSPGQPPQPQASQSSIDPLFLAEINALRTRISQCWYPPPGINASSTLHVLLRVMLKPDGTLAGDPRVDALEGEPTASGPAMVESAKQALLQCQPFAMLKPEHYDKWKDLEMQFDPRELLSGRAQ